MHDAQDQSLAALRAEDPTLLPSAIGAGAAAPEPDLPRRGPDRLGDYQILGVLGEGGMGKVYLAEQHSPRRTVALKVIRPGWATPALLRRFEHEAQVLGRLQHPGIAQVFEAGVHDERGEQVPFFAMECVRGRSLLEYADAERLDTRARLDLLARVCDAVQHAHAKGVIHRDLKPGNILVLPDGSPKVLDFGVARVTDADVHSATLCTVQGELVGTVPYMSPEQIAGDTAGLDTRSDVYTLGVVLYELLSGRLPHDVRHSSIAHAARVIGEEEPARLSSVNRVFRGGIQTIVCKALEKNRERRYQSASDLAEDIRRFLRGEPIAARRPRRSTRLRAVMRRHELPVGVAAVVAMACALTLAWHASSVQREALQAREAASLASAELAAARREASEARAALEAMMRTAPTRPASPTSPVEQAR